MPARVAQSENGPVAATVSRAKPSARYRDGFMIPAIASPSLNRATKAMMVSAPGRVRKSRSGSITACRARLDIEPTARVTASIAGSGASSVTTGPIAISTATPRSAPCHPTIPEAQIAPDIAASIANR